MAPLLAQKSGVDRVFERLYRHYAADVYRYALAVLRNQADAEDVTQTTFMNAYRALERGETPQTPHNWLIAIAHNVCRQRFRQAARRVQEVGLEDDVADHFVRPEDDDTPTPADIRRALGHLAFNQRAALVMRELEGRSYAEIGDLLELSVTAVETLIFRARRALREQLDGALTCGQAEQLLSRQLDGEMAKADRGQLRAHLRECAACRTLARSQRAQRSALRALGAMPLPSSLASLLGGGASVGAAVAVKAAAVVVTAAVIGGVGYDVHHALVPPAAKHRRHLALTRNRAAGAPVPQVAATHTPAEAAAVVSPAHRRATPTRKRHGNPRGPVVVEQAEPSSDVAVEAAPVAATPSVRKTNGKGHGQSKGGAQGNGKARGQGRGHGAHQESPLQQDGTAQPTGDAAAPPGKPDESPGKPDKSHGNDGSPVPLPELPLPELPGATPDGLTQTSQNQGARIDALRHLHP
jgi:RNA polymerase sigma factor (sigma-70 family)